MNIAGMASDRGQTLMQIPAQAPGGAEVAVVLTDDEAAPVRETAADRDIPTVVLEAEHRDPNAFADLLGEYDIDLVCLDGFDPGLSADVTDAAPPVLDWHASLLPAFAGAGDRCAAALDAGVSVTGATVVMHSGGTERGPLVTQEPVPVYGDDDVATLCERVQQAGAAPALSRAVEWFATDQVTVDRAAGTVAIEGDAGGDFPTRRFERVDHAASLRYGENPHQDAAVYKDRTTTEASVVHGRQRNEGAKALSYNNYNDADAALGLIKEFDEPAAAVIKHTNPAGCAVADTIADAYDRALSTDPMSAFGGIVALNRTCDEATATRIIDSFKEVVVAPGYTNGALSTLREKENLRILACDGAFEATEPLTATSLVGGQLVQERDRQQLTEADLEVVTDRAPTSDQIESMLFAWQTLKHVKSNGILFATGTETVGVGMGQVSRVDAVRLAAMKADEHAEGKDASGAVMASDAFFPFPDGIEEAVDAGIEAVIQPGGSQNDDAVIAAANDHDVAMVFTGTRSFRHD
jgi:phosphoribosylaminoimidazolecarboxamide formyltransferase/IMP cyclohydrolase